MNIQERVVAIISTLRQATQGMPLPSIDMIIAEYGRDPFLILVGCMLSLRTKDTVSLPAARRLFVHARTAQELCLLDPHIIEETIKPVLYYRQKTKQLQATGKILVERYGGAVPATEHELLALPGVGRKTTALVLGAGFGIPAICVDTHVHRISNRLGIIATKTPHETEEALKKIVPEQLWIEYNRLLVMWGQNVCVPTTPFCSRCPLAPLCARVGVSKHR